MLAVMVLHPQMNGYGFVSDRSSAKRTRFSGEISGAGGLQHCNQNRCRGERDSVLLSADENVRKIVMAIEKQKAIS